MLFCCHSVHTEVTSLATLYLTYLYHRANDSLLSTLTVDTIDNAQSAEVVQPQLTTSLSPTAATVTVVPTSPAIIQRQSKGQPQPQVSPLRPKSVIRDPTSAPIIATTNQISSQRSWSQSHGNQSVGSVGSVSSHKRLPASHKPSELNDQHGAVEVESMIPRDVITNDSVPRYMMPKSGSTTATH
jgi:hypothetical protein